MFKPLLTLLISVSYLTSLPSIASSFGDPQLGKIKAPSCVFCHGPNGIAQNNAYPNLNSQNPQYLFNAMKAYQNDQRTGDYASMMKTQLQRLNDQDLKDIAAFYSSLP
ncbi:c-type cytochrome [Vibrio cortegadensis]|uniref:Cytochrome c n=1 Tax=Vibrio cortegadensis TaxID=1328770 RepID=A0ABV4M9F6_9VIBR